MIRSSVCSRAGHAGLTLVELLFALLILAVLGVIANSTYQDYRAKVRRSQAIQDITTLQVRIAHYEVDNRAYPNTLADIGAALVDPWGNA